MSKPKRIQLRRTKGWRKPAGAVVVARRSRWGNPYPASFYQVEHADGRLMAGQEALAHQRALAVRDFEGALALGSLGYTEDDVRHELRGKDLCCWCPLDQPCHADVLLEIANS